MCEACDAYEEVMDALSSFELTNDQGVQLLANLILTFNGREPGPSLLMLGILNGRVLELLTDDNETRH